MRLLLDSVAAVAASTDPAELARGFTERLFETLHARRVGRPRAGPPGRLRAPRGPRARGRGDASPSALTPQDLAIVERACREGNFVTAAGEEPGGDSLCAMPLALPEGCLGGIVLGLGDVALSFEGSDRKFLDALASEMAVALDRVRLIERERERQREEKERLEAEVTDLRRVVHGSRFAYRSPAMEALLATRRKVAHTDTTVLITGESGTGKEMLASHAPRAERPARAADGGGRLQRHLAHPHRERALRPREGAPSPGPTRASRAGSPRPTARPCSSTRSATCPSTCRASSCASSRRSSSRPSGAWRPRRSTCGSSRPRTSTCGRRWPRAASAPDLFHRLNVVRLHVPPLRERREDIVHLAGVFLKQFAALYRRPAHHFTPRAEAALEAYGWPGNVRELQNLVLTSVLFCDAPEVDVEDLQGLGTALPEGRPGGNAAVPAGRGSRRRSTKRQADPATQLRAALGREISAALATGNGLAPLGKWLAEDLVLAADRLVGRRIAARRRPPRACPTPRTGASSSRPPLARRPGSPSAPHTGAPCRPSSRPSSARGRPARTRAQRAEACLLAEIEAAAPGDPRAAAALLGVTEPTLLRRKAALARRS